MIYRYSLILESGNGEKRYVNFSNGRSKATLEQIDFITSQYANMNDFLTSLQKQITFDFIPHKVYIAYQYMGEEKKLDLIYNNQKINRISLHVLRKKARNSKDVSIEFINRDLISVYRELIELLSNEYTSNVLLGSKRILPYRLTEFLKEYARMSESTSTTREAELRDISASIKSELSKYKIYRDTQIGLLKLYKKLPKQTIEAEKNLENYTQMHLSDFMNFDTIDSTEEIIQRLEENESVLRTLISEGLDYEGLSNINDHENIIVQIEDQDLREAYQMCGEDPDAIINYLGIDKVSALSAKDKYLVGLNQEDIDNKRNRSL